MVVSGAEKVEGIGAIVDEEQALAVCHGRHAEEITGSVRDRGYGRHLAARRR